MRNKLCKLALLSAFCCSLASPPLLNAQTHTTTYSYPNNIKGYSAMMATDAVGYETLFAGTIYNFNGTGRNAVHFLRDNGTGFPATSVYFDNPNWADLRAVSIVGDGASSGAVYTIVCSYRTTSGTNGIALINTDINGTYLGGSLINSGYSLVYQPIFPLNAIRHSNGSIYICGYWLEKQITYPTQPDFTYAKQGFIMKFTSPGSLQVKLINTTYGSAPAGVFDYDIAMRVIETSNGNLLVTGSVNNCYTGSILPNPPKDYYTSATMNVYTGPNLEHITEDHFANRNFTFTDGGEYGVGLVEDAANNTRYIVNDFFAWHTTLPTIPTSFDNTWPTSFAFTRLTPSFNIYSSSVLSRARWADFNGAWALQTLPSATSPAPGTTQILVAGLQNMHDNCGSGFSKDTVRPFLYDVNLSVSGGTTVLAPTRWVSYNVQTGTGNFAAPNCYNKLGGGISNAAWNPVFATRYNANTDVVFSAPRWEPASGSFPPRLNLKSVRADAITLATPDCPDAYLDNTCLQNGLPYNVQGLGSGAGLPAPTTVTSYYGTYSGLQSLIGPLGGMTTGPYSYISYAQCSPGTPHYRDETTGINELSTETTKVYPNPTKDQVKVQLANSVNGNTNISVLLINIYGQVVGKLYSGKASALINSLQLPNVTPGIYMIQIWGDDTILHQERLSVQP